MPDHEPVGGCKVTALTHRSTARFALMAAFLAGIECWTAVRRLMAAFHALIDRWTGRFAG